eukprot:CAMPEP_0181497098 /NCGR_PEP_ID=MMETSP1110-20121109/53351_1 /TAXON_ID=174948 /ORGANISM="Symbiodinium sp., Strain CCMP421" /LENGTH=85 /DNA_ID=CAMNT_0023625009 /DNA_START=1 /DNA_END=255 /DNA_ORIENTATION=-
MSVQMPALTKQGQPAASAVSRHPAFGDDESLMGAAMPCDTQRSQARVASGPTTPSAGFRAGGRGRLKASRLRPSGAVHPIYYYIG